ncbi:hypothetical protein E2C01_071108 [Portunus trituberculatus]|uniref:Uncharacterized protein n=1 Tax=Portunus trituberculatus TaxID=210409 RepID=A0A5B7I785_PORTR|nr:hypothetical protein [Portunus trituberculatus]
MTEFMPQSPQLRAAEASGGVWKPDSGRTESRASPKWRPNAPVEDSIYLDDISPTAASLRSLQELRLQRQLYQDRNRGCGRVTVHHIGDGETRRPSERPGRTDTCPQEAHLVQHLALGRNRLPRTSPAWRHAGQEHASHPQQCQH